MGFIDKIRSFFGRDKLISVNYDSKDLDENTKLEHSRAEATYWKTKWAKDFSKKEQDKDTSENAKEKEQEKIKFLIEQEKELKKKEFASVNLFTVSQMIKKQKKDKKIKFTTFDGKKVLGNVTAIGFSPTGLIECVSDKKVIWAGTRLKDVFYWVAGLGNYIKQGIIPLCVDENGRYTPNIMQEEIPQYVRTGDGKFIINRANTKEVSSYVAELNEDMNELNSELESTEETVNEQQKEINEKTREAKLHKDRADKIQSELSMALDKVAELDKATGIIVRQNMAMVSLKEINEELIDNYEKVFAKVMGKFEKSGGITPEDKEWESLREKVQFAKDNLGNITVLPKEEKTSLVENIRPVKP